MAEYLDKLTDYQKMLFRKWVRDIEFSKEMQKSTLALIKLKTGFELVGQSACVNPQNYDYALGCAYAVQDAMNKLEEFDGFYEQAKQSNFEI